MPLDIPWPFPDDVAGNSLRSRFWRLRSNATLFAIGSLCKIWMQTLNTTNVHNYDNWLRAVRDREKGRPLLTICNHTSNIDDPLLFGLLPMQLAFSPSSLRWGLGAHNVCFKKPLDGTFCSLGKIIPVIRGDGVYQRGVDMILEKMDEGGWAHLFPEGKVNMEQEWMRLKWGMGRLVSECRVPPLVLPFWHEGLTDVLPHKLPYRLQTGKKVTVVFGEVIDSTDLLTEFRGSDFENSLEGTLDDGDSEGVLRVRKAVTDYFQNELLLLRESTRKLHFGEAWHGQIGQTEASSSNVNMSNSAETSSSNTNMSNSAETSSNTNMSNSTETSSSNLNLSNSAHSNVNANANNAKNKPIGDGKR